MMNCSIEARNCSEHLEMIRHELVTEPVTSQQRKKLFEELEEVSDSLQQLEAQASHVNRFVQSYLNELKEKVVHLYGEIDDYSIKYEVSLISKETDVLQESIQKQDMALCARLVDQLSRHISTLLDSFAPALEDRRVIVLARLMMEKASALLEDEEFFEMDLNSWTFLEAEAAVETLSDLLSQNERQAAREAYKKLTQAQKRAVAAYFGPEEEFSSLFHDVERTANHEHLFLV